MKWDIELEVDKNYLQNLPSASHSPISFFTSCQLSQFCSTRQEHGLLLLYFPFELFLLCPL